MDTLFVYIHFLSFPVISILYNIVLKYIVTDVPFGMFTHINDRSVSRNLKFNFNDRCMGTFSIMYLTVYSHFIF